MTDASGRGPLTFQPGIRFAMSVILLLSALNLVALGTVMVVLMPRLMTDQSPMHRSIWEASRSAESLHAQMLVDAERAQGASYTPVWPDEDVDALEGLISRSLEEDFPRVEQDLKFFVQSARRWYQAGLPVPQKYRGGFTPEDQLARDALTGGVDDAAAPTEEVTEPEAVEEDAPTGEVAQPDAQDAEEVVAEDEPTEAPVVTNTAVDDDLFRTFQGSYLQLQDRLSEVVAGHLVEGPRQGNLFGGYLLVWIVLMAAITIYLAWRLRALISDPLVEITHSAVAIGEGKLDTHVAVVRNRNDEVGALALAVETMRTNLHGQFSELQRQNQRMDTIFSAMNDGVLLVDAGWKLRQYNTAALRLLGLEGGPATWVDHDVRTLGVAALAEPLPSDLSSSRTVELHAVQEDSTHKHLRVIRRRLVGAAGRPAGFVAVLHDVTREKELDQVKNDFFSMVTHELKTPLTAIEGYTKLLLMGRPGPVNEEQERFLRTVTSQTDVLKGMIQDLLDMSRIAAGRLALSPETVDVAPLMARVVERFRPQAAHKELELLLREPDGEDLELQVEADASRLEQVLGNLVTNAMKFTPAGGTITLGWTPGGGMLRASVTDTGKGIPQDALARVFDKFYQVEQGDTRSAGGAGLGLFICREIVAAHGGELSVSSQLGKGSVFTLEIPAAGDPVNGPTSDD